MIKKISQHLQRLAKTSESIHAEFYPSEKENKCSALALTDPLMEEKHSPVRGVCQKYPYRVLIELTLNCAAFCRFCTRRRKVTDIKNGQLTLKEVKEVIKYIQSKPEIKEVIFSGGDPLMATDLLAYALDKFSKMPQIKVIRVHTRVPVSAPKSLNKKILKAFAKIKKQPFYLSIHFEHPDELCPETIKAIRDLRKTGAILLSQTVFLKGINDSYSVLKNLFTNLIELGIRPYYIYHCDLVKGVEHFIVPIEREVEIMTELRKNISGIAFPQYVVDTPNGSGKIPIPLNFWKFDRTSFQDFRGKQIKMY